MNAENKICRLCGSPILSSKFIKLYSSNLDTDILFIHLECEDKIKCYICGEKLNLKEEDTYEIITSKITKVVWFKHCKCNFKDVCYVCRKPFKKGEHSVRIINLYRHNDCEFLSNNYLKTPLWKYHSLRKMFEPLGYVYGSGLTEKEKYLLDLMDSKKLQKISNKDVRDLLNIDSFEASYILSNLVKKNIFNKERKGKEIFYKKIMED